MVAFKLRSSKAFVTFVVCVAMFTDMGLANLILPVLPYALSERVGLAQEDVQRWNSILLASFGGAQVIGSLFFGWIGDKCLNRQTPFVLGLVILGASTLCFALGDTLPILLIARLLQGLSSAVVFTVGNALVLDIVGNDGIGIATGYTSMSITLGILLGPVTGGLLYDHAGYFAVFLPAFALLGFDILLRFIMIVEKRIPAEPSPVASSKLMSPSAEVADNTCNTNYNSFIQIDQNLREGHQFLDANLRKPQQNPEAEPLLPKSRPNSGGSSYLVLLSSPRFLVAIISLFMVNSFTTGFDGVLAVYAHETFHFSATDSACLFLILALPTLLSPISGALTDRIGTKLPAAGGLLLLTPTLILLRLIHHGVTSPFAKFGLAMFSVGVSVTLLNPAFVKETTSAVKTIEEETPGILGPYGANAQAYGLLSCAFAGGSMVGPLYAGFTRRQFGWATMSLVMGVLSSVLFVLAVLITGGHRSRRDRKLPASSETSNEENA